MKINDGFTLIELVVTVSVLAVIFCFVLGFNHAFFVKNKIYVLEKQLINGLHYSRNRAFILGRDVTLNPIEASGDWSAGMILFVDNPRHYYTKQDKLIYTWQWQQSPRLKLVWRGFRSTDYLTFAKTLRRSTVNGHFVILQDGVEVRRIVVNRLGRTKR
ncbi:MAG: hypothetical protein A3F46_08375 [Legionellales bacterium RIFCSPHIGHO2_12_FULL_42_9]|nr:MAG: hypothetical protein A3F46_08375 [Legionellales bacterium RIFCSPHIGHO2_12_FULL_42_9]